MLSYEWISTCNPLHYSILKKVITVMYYSVMHYLLTMCITVEVYLHTTLNPWLLERLFREIAMAISKIYGWLSLCISVYLLHLVGQTEKGSQECTTSFVLTHQTVMRLDRGICPNVAKHDYWLSQQADGPCIVEKATRQTERQKIAHIPASVSDCQGIPRVWSPYNK